jgi:iron complex outermembrane receptor protein
MSALSSFLLLAAVAQVPPPEDRGLAVPPPPAEADIAATGSRAAENAVRQAGDAFGTSVGREVSGLYNRDRVRGFSPVIAGNVRIDGLYFDPVATPSSRLSRATIIRVGPSALGSPFPAPTGIVDFGFRRPGDDAAASLLVAINTWGTPVAELDASVPVNDRLSIGVGAGVQLESGFNKTRDHSGEGALIVNWRPADGLSLLPFISVRETWIDDHGPTVIPAGDYLPPLLPLRQFFGPRWSTGGDTEINAGLLADWQINPGWLLRAGLFRSQRAVRDGFANVIRAVSPEGIGQQRVVADPPLFFGSTSGEVRLTRQIDDGPRRHQIHFAVRGRAGDRRFDGSQVIELGPVNVLGTSGEPPPPAAFNFGPQQDDKVRQWTAGIAYEGRWQGVGELSVGLQGTDYRKRIGLPTAAPTATDARLLLWNVTLSAQLAEGVSLYGGAVTGLEESGIAPNFAANRNEALPAIQTRQFDAGLRFALGPMRAVAGLFQVSKPYFNLDANGRFDVLGDVINRGVEASIAGPLTEELSVVAGASLLWPRVTGVAVDEGRIGRLPVGAITERFEISADWRPGFAPGASLDVRLSYRSPEMATVSNLVSVPARTVVDLGGRYTFRLVGQSAVLRVQVANLFNEKGFDLRGAGAYGPLPGRVAQAYVTMDF